MNRDLPAVPVRRWTLRNFKSVRAADIDLAHLNVLVGANSSGKSSLIQSILAAAQAAAAPNGTAFPLNGPQVRLGEFRDLLHANVSARGEVGIGGTVEVEPEWFMDDFEIAAVAGPIPAFRRLRHDAKVRVSWRTQLRRGPKHAQGTALIRTVMTEVDVDDRRRVRLDAKVGQPSPDVVDAFHRFGLSDEAERSFTLGLSGDLRGSRSAGRVAFQGATARGGLALGVLTLDHATRLLAHQWLESVFNTFRHLPVNTRQERQELEAQERREEDEPVEVAMQRLLDWALEDLSPLVEMPVADAFSELSFLRRGRSRRLITSKEFQVARDRSDEFLDMVCARLGIGDEVLHPLQSPQANVLRGASLGVLRFLSQNIRYLGPLREDPQVVYRSAGSVRPGDIGPKGEFAAAVLHANRLQSVRMPLPDGDEEEQTLESALNFWLSRIGAAQEISTEDRGALGYDMRVRQTGLPRSLDLTSVGVGVSQLLPVLMMCLLSDPGDLLLLEQPELHLHPALQQDLADFLLACALSGRQLIVETHSEYLVSRLRRRIAADRSDLTLKATQLLFVERDPVTGTTEYRPVPTNRYGGIENWPRDFFAQTPIETQEIMRQGLLKSEHDEEMVVGFMFRTPDESTIDDHLTDIVLEALAGLDEEVEGVQLFVDIGPLFSDYPIQRRPQTREPRVRHRARPSPQRERAVQRLVRTIGWREGSVERLMDAVRESRIFLVRVVGIPLEAAHAVDRTLRAKDEDYVGVFEFLIEKAEEVFTEVESSLVRRFSIEDGQLTVLPTHLSAEDAAGVVESLRRAEFFKNVSLG